MPYYTIAGVDGEMAVKAKNSREALLAVADADLGIYANSGDFSTKDILEFLTSKPTQISKTEYFKLRQQARRLASQPLSSRLSTAFVYD